MPVGCFTCRPKDQNVRATIDNTETSKFTFSGCGLSNDVKPPSLTTLTDAFVGAHTPDDDGSLPSLSPISNDEVSCEWVYSERCLQGNTASIKPVAN